MNIYNSTSVPDKYIKIIVELVKPHPQPDIVSLTIRNKREGFSHGNWGKYYSQSHEITVCLPGNLDSYSTTRPYSRREVQYEDRYEWLAAVIGHEYQHGWQYHNKKHLTHAKEWMEVDCEEYEEHAVKKWKELLYKDTVLAKSLELDGHATKSFSYRDYR